MRRPWNRVFIWILPIVIMAVWSLVINAWAIRMEVSTHKADELGSYQLDFMIGKSGMGEVWRARHKMLARDTAIKLIRPDMLAGSSNTGIGRWARFQLYRSLPQGRLFPSVVGS